MFSKKKIQSWFVALNAACRGKLAVWQLRGRKWQMSENRILGTVAHVPVMTLSLLQPPSNLSNIPEIGMWRRRIQWMKLNKADKRYPLQPHHHRPRHSSMKVRSGGLSIKWHKRFAADEPWCSYSAAAPVSMSVPSSFLSFFFRFFFF